jgi:hypothetical protein
MAVKRVFRRSESLHVSFDELVSDTLVLFLRRFDFLLVFGDQALHRGELRVELRVDESQRCQFLFRVVLKTTTINTRLKKLDSKTCLQKTG